MIAIKIPSPGESITEVEIANWLVSDNDFVKKDQVIAEIDSDKATLELVAQESGVIRIKIQAGVTAKVGEIACEIDTEQKKSEIISSEEIKNKIISEEKTLPKVENYAQGVPSPSAEKLINEKGISISDIIGTGKSGRITKSDVLDFQAKHSMGTQPLIPRNQKREKLSVLRRKVAQRLVSVKNQTAMLTTFNEVDMTEIYQIRDQYKDAFKEKHGVGLGFMSFFTLAVVRALKLFPEINAMIDENEKIVYDYCDISVAVSGPKGLMVPVVRNAEMLSFKGVEKEIKRLAIRAREGEITVDEMTGGTFTITNGGVFGSMLSTPIINPPQSAILGMHNVVERPVVKNGQIVVAPVMYLALSYDHRIIDGRESVGFLVEVKKAIENPLELLMNNDAKTALEL